MRRFTRCRRFRRAVAGPYSREGTRFAVDLSQVAGKWESYWTVVPPVEVQGNRKVKNMSVSVGVAFLGYPICYTLFYLPANVSPTGFLANTVSQWDPRSNTWVNNWSSTYDPNQNVLASGVVESPGDVRIWWTGLRTLNSGDRIVIGFHNIIPAVAAVANAVAVVDARYSIWYY